MNHEEKEHFSTSYLLQHIELMRLRKEKEKKSSPAYSLPVADSTEKKIAIEKHKINFF